MTEGMDWMMRAVTGIRFVGDITGTGITDQWDVSGSDLGIPVWSPSQQRMYFLFGDTFGVPKKYDEGLRQFVPDTGTESRNWRGTVAGYTSNLDTSAGIQWEGFLGDEEGNARALIPALYAKNEMHTEVTKISQGGVEVDGALYVFYESIRHWGPKNCGRWYVNYGGAIKSTDGGKSFQRVRELTWTECGDKAEFTNLIRRLAQQDERLQPGEGDFDIASHEAPSFGQIYALDGKDGYIYLYGRHGGRVYGIKAARVKRERIESFNEYEYLVGFQGCEPVWAKGQEGLRLLRERKEACDIIAAPTSNMCVSFNKYLGGWLLLYYKPQTGIMYTVSDAPYGPYPQPRMMLPIDHPILIEQAPLGGNRLYGGFTHEMLSKEDGKRIPLIISQWTNQFYNSKMLEVTFE